MGEATWMSQVKWGEQSDDSEQGDCSVWGKCPVRMDLSQQVLWTNFSRSGIIKPAERRLETARVLLRGKKKSGRAETLGVLPNCPLPARRARCAVWELKLVFVGRPPKT